MKTTKCVTCGKDITNNNFKRHINSCKGVKTEIKQFSACEEENMFECLICGKKYNKYGIKLHIWRKHGEGVNFTKNNDYSNGRTAPLKGKTYEEYYGEEKAEILKNQQAEHMKNRDISEKTKEKLRLNAIERGFGGCTIGGGRGKKGWIS